MIRKKMLLIIFGVVFFLVIGSGSAYMIFTHPRKNYYMAIDRSQVVPYLKDGDVILRLINSSSSQMFKNYSLTDRRFSHLGIVRIRGKKISVINTVGFPWNRNKGMAEVSLDYFLSPVISIGVFRVKSVDGTIISDKAAEYIGYPFDWNFDLTDDSKIYCTELLYAVLKSLNVETNLSTRYLDKLGRDIIPLESVSNNPDIDEILYIPPKRNPRIK